MFSFDGKKNFGYCTVFTRQRRARVGCQLARPKKETISGQARRNLLRPPALAALAMLVISYILATICLLVKPNLEICSASAERFFIFTALWQLLFFGRTLDSLFRGSFNVRFLVLVRDNLILLAASDK